jgi:hypothetical protein
LITYPDNDALPSTEALRPRIDEVLERIPLSGAQVCDSLTSVPYFAPAEPSWTAADILCDETLEPSVERDTVLRKAITRIETASVDKPPWQVVRYTSPSGSAYLAISAQHELLDGIGLLRLVGALTTDDISDIPTERFNMTVGMSSPDYKPSITHLLPVIYREMLIPKLPSWLQSYLRPTPTWPTSIDRHPSTAPWDFLVLSLPPDLLHALSRAGKGHEVNTLHPILHVAYLQVMRDVFGPTAPGTTFVGSSPRNERDTAQGHSYLAGNYSSSVDWALPEGLSFWEACLLYSEYLHSPAGISAGRQAMGMLGYLPDSVQSQSDDPKRATGWEDYYTTKFENGENTYGQSLSFSNLGRTALPPNATDLIWGFPGSPFAPPVSVALIGHEQGLRVYTTWREGCPVTREGAKAVEMAFKKVLEDQVEH